MITDDIEMKLHVHNNVLVIQIYFKFHQISVNGYLVMAHIIDLKGITHVLMKLNVHHHITVMHSYFKFHEIPFSAYLVMASDRRTDGRTDGRTWTKHIPPPSAGLICECAYQ